MFFTPHVDWAGHYAGDDGYVYMFRLDAHKVCLIPGFGGSERDEKILDAMFDRNYDELAVLLIHELKVEGYRALQTTTESEMVVAFDNTNIHLIGRYS